MYEKGEVLALVHAGGGGPEGVRDALFRDTLDGRCLWRDTPLKQARPAGK